MQSIGLYNGWDIWEKDVNACMLISLADMKTILGIGDASQDVLLTRLIEAYTASIHNYCQRILCPVSHTVNFRRVNGSGYQTWDYGGPLWLPQFPVRAITSVTIDTVLQAASTYYVDNRLGYLHSTAGMWGCDLIEVVYDAGFSPVPGDLENAIVQLVTRAYNASGSTALGASGSVKMERIEGAIMRSYFSPNDSSSAGTAGKNRSTDAVNVGTYAQTLDMYRSERCFF